MLKENTKYDIIYLYSINDTPQEFIKIIESLNVKVISYNDKNITYDIQKFKSYYEHFNTLRTCNYLFALKLIEYKKICIIESDMVIMKNLDSIFELKTPSILYYPDNDKITENNKIKNISNKEELLTKTVKGGFGNIVNGGVLLFKPSLLDYEKSIENLNIIISKNSTYPNESLYLYTMNNLYNLPIQYNLSHYKLKKYVNIKNELFIVHFNQTKYKPLDIIKDKYINKEKNLLKKYIVVYFKKKYYNKYHELVNKLMKLIS
jgi:alpha-N-acetylglucosamine transferase